MSKALDLIKDFFRGQKQQEYEKEQKKPVVVKKEAPAKSKKKPHKSLCFSKETWVFSIHSTHPKRSKYHIVKTLFSEEAICGSHLNPSPILPATTTPPPNSLLCKSCLKFSNNGVAWVKNSR